MRLLFIIIPSLCLSTHSNRVISFLNTLKLWYLVLCTKSNLIRPSVLCNFKYLGVGFAVKLQTISDIAVLKEVFLDKEYDFDIRYTPKSILDLGAHIGDTALYFHTKYPSAIIYAVEPDPSLFVRLCENVRSIKNIVPIQAAIGASIGEMPFFTSPSSSLSGSLTRRNFNSLEVKVPVLTMSELFSLYKISKVDICKFDIEGGEEYMFIEKEPGEFSYAYIGELHGDLMSVPMDIVMKHFDNYSVILKELPRTGRYNLKAIQK